MENSPLLEGCPTGGVCAEGEKKLFPVHRPSFAMMFEIIQRGARRAGCPKGKMNMWDIVKISLHIVGATLAVALVECVLNPL